MAEPATAEPTPTNSGETRADHATRFEPGNKVSVGNKGGRPKGLAKRVREAVEQAGGDQNTLVTIMVQHATGYRQMLHPTETVEDEETGEEKPVEKWEEVGVSEQQAAIRWLADRGYGKALEFVPIEDEDPLELGADPHRFSADFEHAMDELRERRLAREAAEA